MWNVLTMLWNLLKYPIYGATGIIIIIMIWYFVYMFYFKIIKKYKPATITEHNKIKKDNILKVVNQGLKWKAEYESRRDPGEIKDSSCGCILIVGEIGQGKTATAIRELERYKEEFPQCKTMTNINYKNQDKKLKEYKDILNFKNERKGSIILIDEVMNLFFNRNFSNFPPEMLAAMTQQRKNAMRIYMTAQRLMNVDKVIRESAQEIWHTYKIFGSIIIILKFRYKWKENGEVDKRRLKNIELWNLDNKIINIYDTYELVDKQKFVNPETQAAIRNRTNNNKSII